MCFPTYQKHGCEFAASNQNLHGAIQLIDFVSPQSPKKLSTLDPLLGFWQGLMNRQFHAQDDAHDASDIADATAAMRLLQSKHKKVALEFFESSSGLDSVYLLKTILQPQLNLLHVILSENDAAYEVRQLDLCLSGQPRKYHLCDLHFGARPGGRIHGMVVKVITRWLSESLWAHLPQTQQMASRLAILSMRTAATTHELLIRRALCYPYKLFAILQEPAMADIVAEDFKNHPCLFDIASTQVLQKHPTPEALRSPDCMTLLRCVAVDVIGNTFDIERLHSKHAARVRKRGTHLLPLQQLALFHQARGCSPWTLDPRRVQKGGSS